jgi:hypothetical protein
MIRLQRIAICLLAAQFVLLAHSGTALASGAMPHHDEALERLNTAIAIIGAPTDLPGDNDQKVRRYIAKYREIFAAAGYDYEKSIIKIINDIQFERYRVNQASIKMNALARELLRMHVRLNINPRKYLSKDCAELLIEFRALIRSNSQKYGSC